MTKSAPQSEGKQYDKTLIYRSYCIQASRTCRTALYRNIEHCSISRYLDNLSVYTDLVFINSVGLRNIIKDMMLVLKDLEEWLEKQVEDAKSDIEFEVGEACLIPKARLEAYQKVLERMKRL